MTGATIRSDLRELELKNLIKRTHGGATLIQNTIQDTSWFDPSYNKRIEINRDLKVKIGRTVSKLIEDEDTIMIDDGSTTLEVVKHLPDEKKITIITNGLNICLELRKRPDINILSVGGFFNKTDLSFNGKIAEQTTKKLHATKAILGATGISVSHGITTPEEEKAELKKIMIENSTEVIIVADHTKLEKVSLLTVCEISKITTLVTDDSADKNIVERFKDMGINVILSN